MPSRAVQVRHHRGDVSFVLAPGVPRDGDGGEDAHYERDRDELDEREARSAPYRRAIGFLVDRGTREVAAHGEILTRSSDGIVKTELQICHDRGCAAIDHSPGRD